MNNKENEPFEKLCDINNNNENSPDITKIKPYRIIIVSNIDFIRYIYIYIYIYI